MAGRASQSVNGYRERNSTADRALDVLQLFSDEELVLSGADISERLGVARSTGYRYLQSLVGAGFIEDTAGGFRLGPRVLELARLARKGIGLSDVALPAMRQLVRETKETALLLRRSADVVVCLDLVTPDQAVHISYERGQVLPLDVGAAADVLLAWDERWEVAMLLKENSLRQGRGKQAADPQQLERRFDDVRDRGLAVSKQGSPLEIIEVAAPVFGSDGRVRAAVSVAALSQRLSDARLPHAEEAVAAAAADITQRLALVES